MPVRIFPTDGIMLGTSTDPQEMIPALLDATGNPVKVAGFVRTATLVHFRTRSADSLTLVLETYMLHHPSGVDQIELWRLPLTATKAHLDFPRISLAPGRSLRAYLTADPSEGESGRPYFHINYVDQSP